MRTCIFQCWNGPHMPGIVKIGSDAMRAYAERIGAEYRFHHDDRFTGELSKYCDTLRPMLDPSFWNYDRVLYADLDVFPTGALADSVFDEPVDAMAIALETQPNEERRLRKWSGPSQDEDPIWREAVARIWSIDLGGMLNGGVVLWSRDGMRQSNEAFCSIWDYRATMKDAGLGHFYTDVDQPYLNCVASRLGDAFRLLPQRWNQQVKQCRTKEEYWDHRCGPGFVHVMVKMKRGWDAATYARVVNLPVSQWGVEWSPVF